MADTVKKSRIVSEDEDNLEESLLEEFNMRLKNCMSKDDLQQPAQSDDNDVQDYKEEIQHEDAPTNENLAVSPISRPLPSPKGAAESHAFIEMERSYSNGHPEVGENIYETLPDKTDSSQLDDQYIDMSDVRSSLTLDVSPKIEIDEEEENSDLVDASYEIIDKDRPSFSLTKTDLSDINFAEETGKSVKDRMFLATDDAAATLLFTQTVTSPMLTPSEENIDFLKGFQRENTNSDTTVSNDSVPKEGNDSTDISAENSASEPVCEIPKESIYENAVILKQNSECLYENLKDLKQESENIYENLESHEEHIYQDIEECNTKVERVYENLEELRDKAHEEMMVENALYNNLDDISAEIMTNLDASVKLNDGCEVIKSSETVEVQSGHKRILEDHSTIIRNHVEHSERSELIINHQHIVEHVELVENGSVVKENHTESTENAAAVENRSKIIEHSIITENDTSIIENCHAETQEQINNIIDLSKKLDTNSDVVDDRSKASEKLGSNGEVVKRNCKSDTLTEAIQNGTDTVTTFKSDTEVIKTNGESNGCSKESYSEFVHHSKSESSNYYEKYTEVVSKTTKIESKEKDTETVPPEIVKNLKVQFLKTGAEVVAAQKKDIGSPTELRTVNILNKINKFEHKEDGDGDREEEDDSTVTECYTETTIQSSDTQGGEEKAFKKKKTKKSRKEEKENISVKSSFSKFDALQKKNVLQVRSSDSAKAQEKINGTQQVDTTNCKACSKAVFQMEQIKAEKAIWHKNCFRCTECSKQLTVETYISHEGNLYCKPHFKSLFAPKVVEDDAPSSDKPDLGLEELQSLNVKERFQIFEQHRTEVQDQDRSPTPVNVKRAPSILSKLARFQAKGMDVGVPDEDLNGIPIEESSSEEEGDGAGEDDEECSEGEDATLYKARRAQREKPFHFTNMHEVKNKWEHGAEHTKDERREERKQEIQSIRNKLFLGKQGKMKEAYQQAVMQSESCVNIHKSEERIESCDTKSLKERFEKGELYSEKEEQRNVENENEVYQSEISKKSRSLFLELDANASKPPQLSPVIPPKTDIRKARETDTPEREIYHDPDIVRADEYVDDSVIAKTTHTASKMLNKFRQMEENLSKEPEPAGPKPLKRFTPPPEPARPESASEEESEEEEEEEDETDNQKLPEDLIEAQKAARAKQLRAKFEKWEAQEIKREQNQSINIVEEYGEEQIESTKTLRQRFEQMKETSSDNTRKPVVKVNRFV